MSIQRRANTTRPRSHRFALEPRQLFDGAAVAEAASHADNPLDAQHHDNAPDASKAVFVPPAPAPAPASITAPAPADASAPHEVYVVDSHVQNWQSLVSQLPEGSRVLVLDSNQSGLEQINDALKNDKNITALHIISHGANDEITLGSDKLNEKTIAQYQQQLETLGEKLTNDGDILLYGCNVTEKDTTLITRMADYTHADVAASNDETGSAAKGADWALESHVGEIETRSLSLAYDGVLQAPELTIAKPDIVVSEPTTLHPGAETGAFIGLTLTPSDDANIVITVKLSNTAAGDLVNGSERGKSLEYLGPMENAQAWLDALRFTASDTELGNQSASTDVVFEMLTLSGGATLMTHVTITPANDPVTVPDSTLTVPERSGTGTVITQTTLAAFDPDVNAGAQSNSQIVYSLTAIPQYGYLTLNGTRLGIGSVFTQADVNSGALRYFHTATGTAQNTADGFSAKVNDGATPIGDSDTVNVTLEIAPENQPPTISGGGIVYEGQPANAVGTGNVGQYIVADGGGDTQDTSLTLTITSLPSHGTLYFKGVPVFLNQQIDYGERNLLTYANDGEDNQTQDTFGVRVTDLGGGTATPASSDTVIRLDIQAVDDDPVLDADSTLHADVVPGPADVTLTPEMLTSVDIDSSAERVSFIVDTAGLTHGYLTLNGLRLQTGDTFSMEDVLEGKVVYSQYLNAQPGGIDVFNFRVIDHSTALRWNADGTTFTRQGGIWDGNSPTDQLTHFQFTIGLVRLATNPTPDNVPPWSVPDSSTSSGYIGSDPGNPTLPPHGSINEGGSLTLTGTGNISASTPGMSYIVQGVSPDQIVYTYLGTDAGQSGLTIMKSDGNGGMVVVNAFGSFTQAQLDAGQVRIVHNGGENFEFTAHFSVSAGQVTLDARGNPIPVTWNPDLKIFVTPVNDAPVITGSANTVIAEGDTVYITTSQINLSDPDDANSGSSWETVSSINGSNNYALNNEVAGDNALKIVFQSLPTGGVLQYLKGTEWVTITSADIGTLKLDASLLKSDNTSGLRFVSNGSEVRNTSFIVTAVDRWGESSATNATVGITITNVNDGPQIPTTPDSPDIVVPPDSPNNIGGQPANNPATVVEGGYVQLNNSQLQAYDPDSSPEQVQFTISTVPAHGRLAYSTDGVNFSFLGSGSTFTQADINNGHIYYLNNGDETTGTGQNADGFNFTLSDGDKEQAGNHFAINVTPTNDKPTVTAPSGPIDVGGGTHAVNGFKVADPDIASGSSASDHIETTVRLLHSNGSAFSQAEYNGIVLAAATGTGATVTGGVNGYLVITGTVAQVNAALAGLTVTFPDDRNAQYQVQVITDDRLRDNNGNLTGTANGGPVNQPATPSFGTPPGTVDGNTYNWYADGVPASNGNISANKVVINASETNDSGSLVVNVPDKTTFEDQPGFIGGGIVITDDESTAFGKPVTVTLTVPQGTLGIGGANDDSLTTIDGVTIQGDNSGTLILTGTADAIQALLNNSTNGLTYLSAKDANHDQNGTAAGDVTLNIHLDTSTASVGNTTSVVPADVQIAITITPVNDAPTVTAPTDTILLDNNDPGGNNVGGFVISDPDVSDAGGIATGEQNIVQVTVRITDQNGNPFQVLQYRDQQNSAVNISSLNTTSGVTVQTTSPDGTNPPSNGVNAPLVITGTLAQINAYLAQLQVRMSGIQVDDADQYFRVEVIVDDRVRDASGNLTGTANGGDNIGPGGVGTVPVPTTAISPYGAIPAGLTENVTSVYRTVFQSSINDPTHIDLGGSPVLATDERSATVTLPKITLSDVDAGSQSMTVTVKLPAGFTFVAPTGSGGTVTGAGTDTLTFTGSFAQINTYLAALKVSLPDAPGTANRSDWNGNFGVTVTVNDGGNSGSRPVTLPNLTDPNADPGQVEYEDGPGGTSSALVTTRIFTFTVNPVNDAPLVVGTPTVTIPTLEEDTLGNTLSGQTVNNLFSGLFNDQHDTIDNSANGGAGGSSADNFYGVAITQLTTNAAQGEWQYSLDGINWIAVGNRSDSNALILTATSSLRFVPAANYFGNPATLGVRLVETNLNGDKSTTPTVPTNGSVTNISGAGGHGGSSIYSETVVTLSTVVTNINDRPTLGDKTLIIAEDTNGTQTVGQLFQSVYGDATDNQSAIAGGGNASGALSHIAIYGNTTDASKGQWQYFDGTTWQAIPSDVEPSNAFVLASNTQMRFVPTADYNGSVSGGLQLRASDTTDTSGSGSGIFGGRVNFFDFARDNDPTSHWSNTATLTVSITPVVDAFNDTFTTHANVPLVKNASDLLANDTFSSGDVTLTGIAQQPTNGTLTYVNGVLTYTPNPGFVGTDSYTYTAVSGGVSETATVTITVTNLAPIPTNDSKTLNEDTSATGNVLTNDRDPDGAVDTLSVKTFTVEGQTYAVGTTVTLADSHGTLIVNADGTYAYTPGGDWHGDILVNYVVTDGNMNGDRTATLNLHVNAVDDAVDNIEKEHTGTVITTDVLANDKFSNADKTITGFTQGEYGTVTRGPGNSLIYTPTPGYVGQDKYTYTITSGGIQETATVFILLTNTPPTPTAQVASTPEDTALKGDVLHSIIDPDGDPLHVTDFQIAGIAGTHLAGESVVIADKGTFILRADGTYSFVPIADWNGIVPTITFNVSDNTFDPPTQSTLDITVTPVQDFVNDSVTTHAGTPVNIDALHNDRFSNANATITDTSTPQHGTVSIVGNKLVYTPNAGYVGEDSFTYTVTSGGVQEVATVTVTMTNTLPSVPDVYVSTLEDRLIFDTLLGNATDIDNDTLRITTFTINGVDHPAGLGVVDIPGMGKITITAEGLYIFSPLADWNGVVPPITFTVSDGNQGSEVNGTLVITVRSVVDIAPDQATTHSDDAVIIDVLDNDTFVNPDQTITVSGTSAQGGRVEVLSDNTVRYSPPAGYAGRDSFSYSVTSGGITETTIVTIVVTNESPLTGNMQLTMNEDGTPLSGTLDVTDPDNDVLRVTSFQIDGITGSFPVLNLSGPTVVDIPGVGTFTLGYNRQYTFTPLADWNGIVPQISYTVTDDNGGAPVIGKIDIAVNAVKDTVDDNVTMHAGTSNTTNVLGNDLFKNPDRVVTGIVTKAQHGTVTFSPDGNIIYTPSAAFVGTDSYTYSVSSNGTVETATVLITVTNEVPVAQPDAKSGDEDTTIIGNVLDNDSDADNDTLRVTSFTLLGDSVSRQVGNPVFISGQGQFTLNADGSYSFEPIKDWNGTLPVITYQISDGRNGGTASSTLTLSVTRVADIAPDDATTHAGKPVIIDVLANDTFENSDHQITATTNGLHGTTTIVNGKVIYTPVAGFVGTDIFGYTVTSGGVREVTFVNVTITNTPSVAVDDPASSPEDAVASDNVLTNDSDVDGDKLTLTGFTVDGTTIYAAGGSLTIPDKGVLVMNANGDWTFTPVADWNGTLPEITYFVSDGNNGGESNAKLRIVITEVQDAFDDSVTVHGNSSVTSDVFANDTFANGDKIIQSVTQGSNGTVTIVNGKITYTPNAGYVGTDSYSYTVLSGGIQETATVNVTVENTLPITRPDLNITPEDTIVTGNVLQNDTDADSDPLTVTQFSVAGQTVAAGSSVTLAGVGAFTLRSDGSYTLTPVADWNGVVPIITYSINDALNGGNATNTLTIIIAPVADINADNATSHSGNPVTTDVLANDNFENADATISAVTNGANGTAVLQPDGQIIYTPRSGFVGTDTYTYTVTSGGVTETTTVTVLVTNSVPIVNPEGVITPQGDAVSGNLLTNDSDPDGDPIHLSSFRIAGQTYSAGETAVLAGIGSLTVLRDGSYRFVPQGSFNGFVPPVTYTVSDSNEGGESRSILRILVAPSVEIQVHEDGLTPLDPGAQEVSGTLNVLSLDKLQTFTFQGRVITAEQLLRLNPLSPITIETVTGTITLLAYYSPTDGEAHIDYRFTLRGAVSQPGFVSTFNDYAVEVNGITVGQLRITVFNDNPTATDDGAEIVQDQGQTSASGNLFTDDRIGADGPASNGPVTGVSSENTGNAGTIDGNTNGQYGTLFLDSQGNWQYQVNSSDPRVASLEANSTLSEVFVYTITDSDGNTSEARLTILIHGVTAMPNTDDRNGDQIFGLEDEEELSTYRQSYEPGLFILPLVYDLQSDSVRLQTRLNSQFAAYGYGIEHANAPVMQQAVLFSRWYNDTREQRTLPGLASNGLGQNSLGNSFGPFAVGQPEERAVEAPVAVAQQGAQPIEIPTVIALGAQPLTAQLAALEKQTLASGKPIAVPTITRR
ncbi:Ig-like domain-containing protein [Buttiauxella izardii]|uniref:Tandem-95 repeat protein n=1 Tax=Buttiauxella izardii TaxID=82991 RepID=A0A3A5K3I5_9ENTR|nr:Ig-like domain-containing protein [Buttiauxella izardii]RJT23349.1 tandem-95 repeat protein [Buttiauxella izardii]